MNRQPRPAADEYFEYYSRYISLVPDGDILATLRRQIDTSVAHLGSLTEAQAGHRYAAGKWSVKQCIGHMIDTERIFAYRALRIGRNDHTPIEGFEQDDYVQSAAFDACSPASLIEELHVVRKSTILLLEHLQDEAWGRRGVASTYAVSARALAWIIAGHELHHLTVIREKYFSKTA
ncbi:MAG: DinB family protein [Bryobacteraceae bacterium]